LRLKSIHLRYKEVRQSRNGVFPGTPFALGLKKPFFPTISLPNVHIRLTVVRFYSESDSVEYGV